MNITLYFLITDFHNAFKNSRTLSDKVAPQQRRTCRAYNFTSFIVRYIVRYNCNRFVLDETVSTESLFQISISVSTNV